MSFYGTLKIEDNQFKVIDFKYSTFRHMDLLGRPTSVLFGVKFQLEIEHEPICVKLHEWAYKNYEVKAGSILFMKRDNMHQKDIEFKFKDAYISKIEFDFTNTGPNPMVEKIEIISVDVELDSEGKMASYKVDHENGA